MFDEEVFADLLDFGAKRQARRSAPKGGEYHPPQEFSDRQKQGDFAIPSHRQASGEGSCGAHGDKVAGAPTTAPKVVQTRVDWLTVASKVAIMPHVLRYLHDALAEAPDASRVAVGWGAGLMELRERARGGYLLRCGSGTIVLDPAGVEGWTFEAQFSGSVMAQTTMTDAIALAQHWAQIAGTAQGWRVRRIDLAADVAGFDVAEIEALRWRKPSRARLGRSSVEDVKKEKITRYERGKSVTGYTVCPGGQLQAVVYDKREELQIRQEKREDEQERWRAGGWDGEAPVTRVEFRFRGAALVELGARDGLVDLESRLDGLWGYATDRWLRLQDDAGEVVPAWHAVRQAVFVHAASKPAARRRLRGGAAPAQVCGAALSALGAEGALDWARRAPEEGAEEATRRALDEYMARAARVVADDVIARLGAERAWTWLAQRVGATKARFLAFPAVAPAPKV